LRGDIEAVLCRVLDSMANGVIAIDREGMIFVFNDAAARLLGVGKMDALGKRLLDIVPNSGLVNVLRTGAPETGRPQQIGARAVIGRGDRRRAVTVPRLAVEEIAGPTGGNSEDGGSVFGHGHVFARGLA